MLLTRLIAYGAGCLAGRLAGSLALTAAALLYSVLQNLCIQCLNMLHDNFPPVSYLGERLRIRSRPFIITIYISESAVNSNFY